jgi:uncharacterized protein (TIGR02145 family)
MKRINLILTVAVFVTMLLPTSSKGQVTIGADKSPQAFSILELISNNKGLRLSQLTTAERNSITNSADFQAKKTAEAKGLTIYNTSMNCLQYWNGSRWTGISCIPEPLPKPNIVIISSVGEGAMLKIDQPYPELANVRNFEWTVTGDDGMAYTFNCLASECDSVYFPYKKDDAVTSYTITAKATAADTTSYTDSPTDTKNIDEILTSTESAKLWLNGLSCFDIKKTNYDTGIESDFNNRIRLDPTLDYTYTIRLSSTNISDMGMTAASVADYSFLWSIQGINCDLSSVLDKQSAATVNPFTVSFSPAILSKDYGTTADTIRITCLITKKSNNEKFTFTKIFRVKDSSCGCTLPSTIEAAPYNGYISFQCYNLGAQKLSLADQKLYMANPNAWANGVTLSKGTSPKTTGNTVTVASPNAATINNIVYGDSYQWGRQADGHQLRNSPCYNSTAATCGFNSADAVPATEYDALTGQILSGKGAYGKFIRQDTAPYDWIDNISTSISTMPKWDNTATKMYPARWDGVGNAASPAIPIKQTATDPCPQDWRIPTSYEWQGLVRGGKTGNTTSLLNPSTSAPNQHATKTTWSRTTGGTVGSTIDFGDSSNLGGYQISPLASYISNESAANRSALNLLFLPATGYRNFGSGNITNAGTYGYYWSSTVNGESSNHLYFYSTYVTSANSNIRASGRAIRCVAE